METFTVTDPELIADVLGDERCTVVPPAESESGGLAWVRRHVGRFTEGEAHRRRRALAVGEIEALAPAALRAAARKAAARLLDAGTPLPGLPGEVTARVLGAALGATGLDAFAAAVPVVAAGYITGAAPSAEIDAAVAVMREQLGPGGDEEVAARVSLPLQAYAAVSKLASTAIGFAAGSAEEAVDLAFAEDRPVPSLRRIATAPVVVGGKTVPAGAEIVLSPITRETAFGTGRRPCPAEAQAVALVAGIVEAVRARTSPTTDRVEGTVR